MALPGVDGLCLCRKLRGEAKQDVPILILTARDLLDDKLAAFECGADDYLVKPFALREVEARLNALVVRRRGRVVNKRLSYQAIEYDPDKLAVTVEEQVGNALDAEAEKLVGYLRPYAGQQGYLRFKGWQHCNGPARCRACRSP